MPVSPRLLPLALVAFAVPAAAQDALDLRSEAQAMIDDHRVNLRVGCGVPIPVNYNAPPYEQHAAQQRRQAFQQCLRGVMAREEDRLNDLEARVRDLRDQSTEGDWSEVASAMASKWDELDELNSKLNTSMMWANTAEQILDTFTGPGAPFDSNRPVFNPYQPYQTYQPYQPYRPNRTIILPGIP